MTKFELLRRNAGNVMGLFWYFLIPLLSIAIYYFIFSYGLKITFTGDKPYLLLLITGFIPWLTFSDVMGNSVAAITSNAHLTKKVVFPLEVLPIVALGAALIQHVVMLAVLVAMLFAYKVDIGPYALQIIYYAFALGVLSVGLGWGLSACNVVFRDTSSIVTVILNLWFWVTPIIWPATVFPEHYRWILELNPMYYIIEGYRQALIYGEPFWSQPGAALLFWIQTLIVLWLGSFTLRRLKPEFAEFL